ncbi:MAG: enolase C-terminal domain-like protein [Deltaproteobacteria bacterium]|nr:enolase C-terminal domain-like protein [Deltaproteobacteria bacterium]
MRLQALDIFHLRIPFLFTVRHSLAVRECSESFVVRVETETGLSGYGEGTPRGYVTGESISENITFFEKGLVPMLAGHIFPDPLSVREFLDALSAQDDAHKNPSAVCALETALLDAAGKSWQQSISEIIGLECKQRHLTYSAVVSLLPLDKFEAFLHMVKQKEMKFLKLKVGNESDLTRLALARDILESDVEIRVDANCAWGAEEAIQKIEEMKRYGISAVEQPVAKEDFTGLKKVTESVDVPIIADESLCSVADARRLAEMRACGLFDIRLSKCGGFLNAAKILQTGKEAGVKALLGCHVGETGILSAAGRHFAQCFDELVYIEGSFSSLLLKEDVIQEDLLFGKGGIAPPLSGPGLGITVREDVLKRYAAQQISFQKL